jgi:hypothetical protein
LNTAPSGGVFVLIVIISVGSKALDAFSLTGERCFFSASPSLPSLLGVIAGLAEIFLDEQSPPPAPQPVFEEPELRLLVLLWIIVKGYLYSSWH